MLELLRLEVLSPCVLASPEELPMTNNIALWKWATQGRPFSLLRYQRPQPPPNHIHHITPITQRYRQHLAEVGQHHRLRVDIRTKGNVFQYLGHGADAVVGGFEEDVEGASVSMSRVAGVQSMPVMGMYLFMVVASLGK